MRSSPPARPSLTAGLVAGAAGTLALNAVTYLDMSLRGRAASGTPSESVRDLADKAGLGLGPPDKASNRAEGLGALLGYATGIGVGLGYGLVRSRVAASTPAAAIGLTVAALLAANAPMTSLGITDPRQWDLDALLTDVVPHVAYGAATALAYDVVMR